MGAETNEARKDQKFLCAFFSKKRCFHVSVAALDYRQLYPIPVENPRQPYDIAMHSKEHVS